MLSVPFSVLMHLVGSLGNNYCNFLQLPKLGDCKNLQ